MNLLNHLESFREVQIQWEEILKDNFYQNNIFFNSLDIKKIWWDVFQDSKKNLLFVYDSGKSVIVPIIKEDKLITFLGSRDLFDYQDFIFKEKISKNFITDFLDYCFNHLKANRIQFESIQEASSTLKILETLKQDKIYSSIEIIEEDVAPFIYLPSSWDNFLSLLSKKNRHEIKRKLRRIEDQEKVETLEYSHKNDTIPIMNDLIELMKQDEKKREFFTTQREDFFRKIVEVFSEKKLLRLMITKVNNNLSAGSINFNNGNTNLLYNSGYDFDYKFLSIGLINHIENIKICIENGIKVFDFLRGSEDYKYRLGASDKKIYSVKITD
tara:strand:+ start:1109 stop:2089 length:981 start_codon:yes stop_codon:yes gene_type:complete